MCSMCVVVRPEINSYMLIHTLKRKTHEIGFMCIEISESLKIVGREMLQVLPLSTELICCQ